MARYDQGHCGQPANGVGRARDSVGQSLHRSDPTDRHPAIHDLHLRDPGVGVHAPGGVGGAVNDAVVLNAVTSSYLLSIQGAAAEFDALDLSALTNEKIELTFTNLDRDVTVNGAGIYDVNLAKLAVTGGASFKAWSSGGLSGSEIDLTGTDGLAHKIILIGTAPAALNLYAPLDNGMTLGAHGTPVTGGLTVAQALAASGPVAVTDTAANIAAGLDALQADAANLTGIGFTDSGSPALSLTEAQLTSDTAVLALLSGGYSLAATAANAADATTLAAHTDVSSVSVADTAANITAGLDELEELAKAGKLGGVNITSGSLGTLSSSQLFNDADVIRLIEAGSPPGGNARVLIAGSPDQGSSALAPPATGAKNLGGDHPLASPPVTHPISRLNFLAAMAAFRATDGGLFGLASENRYGAAPNQSAVRLFHPP